MSAFLNSRVIAVAGTPTEIGHAHGETLKDAIHQTLNIYRMLFGLPEAELEAAGRAFKQSVLDLSPPLAEEIDAIAESADVPQAWVYALNARSEIMSQRAPECTAVVSPTTGILAQTWDWIQLLEELFVVLDISHADGRRVLTLTEPGIVGKIGLNNAGLGVCLNFMEAERPLQGTPIHVLLRALLDTGRFEDGLALVDRAGESRAGNIMFAAKDGRALNIEYRADETRSWRVDDEGVFVHTNHALDANPGDGPLGKNSMARLNYATRMVGESTDLDSNRAWQLLSHQDGRDDSICMPFQTYDGVPVGTVCTVVMQLIEQRMQLRIGPDPDAPMETISL